MVEIIKKGEICLYSTLSDGLIPVRYLGNKRNVIHSDNVAYEFKINKEWGGFNKGDTIWLRKTFVTPKRLYKKTGMFSYICTSEFEFEV